MEKEPCANQEVCMQVIQRMLDREASHAEELGFADNQKDCATCRSAYALAKSIKNAIKRHGSASCPKDLFIDIKAKLFLFFILISILIPLFC